MAEVAATEEQPCSNPGCDQPGTKSCSACKSSAYCSVSYQTAHWPKHKEECDGHLRKLGKANLDKAVRCGNWAQTLRYAEIAATKLKKLKDRRLETVELIDGAMRCKYNALGMTGRYKEAKECAEECYTMWAMNQLRNPGSISAALALIGSCIQIDEYEDAVRYGHHAMFMINEMADNFIPDEQRPKFLADTSRLLATAMYRFDEDRGYPPGDKKKIGEEAIAHARKALEIHTQLDGPVSDDVASDLSTLASVLNYFNDVDDDEVLRLFEQSNAMTSRMQGSSSPNVAVCQDKWARTFHGRGMRALDVDDLDRCIINLEQALPHYREAVRIFQIGNRLFHANEALCNIAQTENNLGAVHRNRAIKVRAVAKDLDRCMSDLDLSLPHYREAARVYRSINQMDKVEETLQDIAATEKMLRQSRIEIAQAAKTKK